MNEQILVKSLQSMAQEIANLTLNNHLLKAELDMVKEELANLQQAQQPMDESPESMM